METVGMSDEYAFRSVCPVPLRILLSSSLLWIFVGPHHVIQSLKNSGHFSDMTDCCFVRISPTTCNQSTRTIFAAIDASCAMHRRKHRGELTNHQSNAIVHLVVRMACM